MIIKENSLQSVIQQTKRRSLRIYFSKAYKSYIIYFFLKDLEIKYFRVVLCNGDLLKQRMIYQKIYNL